MFKLRFAFGSARAFGREVEERPFRAAIRESERANTLLPQARTERSDIKFSFLSSSLASARQASAESLPPTARTRIPRETCRSYRDKSIRAGESWRDRCHRPAGEVHPIPVAGWMHGTKLNVEVTDDAGVALAGLEFLSSFDSLADRIDHVVTQVCGFIENDDLRMAGLYPATPKPRVGGALGPSAERWLPQIRHSPTLTQTAALSGLGYSCISVVKDRNRSPEPPGRFVELKSF